MAHTHEFDCVVCGAHFDSQEQLHVHDIARHSPKQAMDLRAPAELMGNDRPRRKKGDEDSMR